MSEIQEIVAQLQEIVAQLQNEIQANLDKHWDGWLVEHKPNPYSLTPQDVFETNVMAQPMRRREDGKLADPLTIEEITEAMRRAGADEPGGVILNSLFIQAISEVLAERA